jgi:hypothetical protein
MKLEAMPSDALLVREVRGEDHVVPALPQLQTDSDQRMQVAERTVGREDDAQVLRVYPERSEG